MSDLKLNRAALSRLLESEQGEVGRFLEKKLQRAEGTAKRLVKVVTGRTKASIKHDLSQDSQGLVGKVTSDNPYLEFGTRFMPAQPALRPAVRQVMR